jgi:hypothetical protein
VKRGLTAAFVLSMAMCASHAAGYDDFADGMTASLRSDDSRAVVSFTKALSSPDLVPAYKPAAYRGRALAYLRLDKCQEALADIKAFEAIQEPDETIGIYRVWAELCLKDPVTARKDYDTILKGKLGAFDLWQFARLEWQFDLFDEAMTTASDAFKAVDKKSTHAPYILLWQAVAAQRAGKLDAAVIVAGVTELGLDDWPKPLFDLYLGKQTPEGVQKEASSWHDSKDRAQRCEANFYTAEWYLGRSDKASATPLLMEVTRNCPVDFIELPAAVSELKRLGVEIPKE